MRIKVTIICLILQLLIKEFVFQAIKILIIQISLNWLEVYIIKFCIRFSSFNSFDIAIRLILMTNSPKVTTFNCIGLFRHSEGTWSRSILLLWHYSESRSIMGYIHKYVYFLMILLSNFKHVINYRACEL